VDLTGASVAFRMEVGGVSLGGAATILSATAGRVSYAWGFNDTQSVGIHPAEFVVTWPGGKPQTFPGDDYLRVEVARAIRAHLDLIGSGIATGAAMGAPGLELALSGAGAIATAAAFGGAYAMQPRSLNLVRASVQHVSFDDGSLDFAGSFTIGFWAKFSTLPANLEDWHAVAKFKGVGGVGDSFIVLFENNAGVYQASLFVRGEDVSDFNGTWQLRWTFSPVVDEWHRYRFTYDITASPSSTKGKFFIDGVDQGSGTQVSFTNVVELIASTTRIRVGTSSNAGDTDGQASRAFNGKVDDVRIYSAVVNDEATRSQLLVGNEANLWAYLRSDNAHVDSGPNDFAITANNSPTFSTDVPF
jgi:hypothetical protein